MVDTPMKSYWMGQPIEDLTREELVAVIHKQADELNTLHEANHERRRRLCGLPKITQPN